MPEVDMACARAASKAQTALDALMDEVFRDLPEDGLSQEEIYRREAEAALAALVVLRTRREV